MRTQKEFFGFKPLIRLRRFSFASSFASVVFRLKTIAIMLTLGGCVIFNPQRTIELTRLKGWTDDNLIDVWTAWTRSCDSGKLPSEDTWKNACARATRLNNPSQQEIREYFETHFVARRASDPDTGRRKGLITGYYEPVLRGNTTPTDEYRWPIYQPPDDLVVVDLGEMFPELANKRVRGRLKGNRVVPYHDREGIDGPSVPLSGDELLWLDDPVDVFFLHVQGSGRVRLPDGRFVKVGYADQNGHRYVSIGRTLVNLDHLKLKDVSLQSIRQWLDENPAEMNAILNSNPSYVFFNLKTDPNDTPSGALGVALTPERSVAVDKRYIPLGSPVWLETTLPSASKQDDSKFRQLTFAQDTGGAIKGGVRADVFWGRGKRAEDIAGHMKQQGRLWILQPRPGGQP